METTFNARETSFLLSLVFGKHIALYTSARIDLNTIPAGLYLYEISHCPEDENELHYISKQIKKWFAGTLITNTQISLPLARTAEIESEDDLIIYGAEMSLEDYMACCPPIQAEKKQENKQWTR